MIRHYIDELDACEQVELQRAHPFAPGRYDRYRRAGHGPEKALASALAWGRNESEARERAVAHGTGAT